MAEPTAAADDEPTVVYLGNRQAVDSIADPDDREAAAAEGRSVTRIRVPLQGKLCTTVRIPAGVPLIDAANDIVHARGVWAAHSDADAPAWVASTDPALAQLLAAHYRCELREPEPEQEG